MLGIPHDHVITRLNLITDHTKSHVICSYEYCAENYGSISAVKSGDHYQTKNVVFASIVHVDSLRASDIQGKCIIRVRNPEDQLKLPTSILLRKSQSYFHQCKLMNSNTFCSQQETKNEGTHTQSLPAHFFIGLIVMEKLAIYHCQQTNTRTTIMCAFDG